MSWNHAINVSYLIRDSIVEGILFRPQAWNSLAIFSRFEGRRRPSCAAFHVPRPPRGVVDIGTINNRSQSRRIRYLPYIEIIRIIKQQVKIWRVKKFLV